MSYNQREAELGLDSNSIISRAWVLIRGATFSNHGNLSVLTEERFLEEERVVEKWQIIWALQPFLLIACWTSPCAYSTCLSNPIGLKTKLIIASIFLGNPLLVIGIQATVLSPYSGVQAESSLTILLLCLCPLLPAQLLLLCVPASPGCLTWKSHLGWYNHLRAEVSFSLPVHQAEVS